MNLSKIEQVTKGNTRKDGISAFSELQLSKVYANPNQPRKEFEYIALMELGHDIRENGLLQPIVVVKRDDGYMIVSGERRYRAHKEWTDMITIKAHIISVDDDKVLELALIENIQREDLTDFEIAVHIGKLQASGNYRCKRDLAKAIGKSQSYLSKAFSCLKLDESIIKDLEAGKRNIGLSVLDEIARLPDVKIQKEVYDLVVKKEITRDEIKNFKSLQGWDSSKVTEVPQTKVKTKKTFISYGFGTVNDMGNFISISTGDLDGRIAIDTENFVKHSNDNNYKITIEEI